MALRFLTAGESHGPAFVAIIEGLPAGLDLPESAINQHLSRRQRGMGSGARMKMEKDRVRILSGVMEGKTIGSPVALMIENKVHRDWIDKPIQSFPIPRPGHADLAGLVKYGFSDIRPVLERASARETSIRVAVGAICRKLLHEFGISIGGYVASLGTVEAEVESIPIENRFVLAEENELRCPDVQAVPLMRDLIQRAIDEKETLGGIIEVIALGLPAGLGSYVHWDRRLDARLGAAILGVQAMKGVEIGSAFQNTRSFGTKVHDAIYLEGDQLVRKTNRCGGLEGGVSNGQPLVVRVAMKPIPTTLTPQLSVNLITGVESETRYERSDICPVPRAVPVLEAVVAYVLADALVEKLGGDSIDEMQVRFTHLRKASLSDLLIEDREHYFWQSSNENETGDEVR